MALAPCHIVCKKIAFEWGFARCCTDDSRGKTLRQFVDSRTDGAGLAWVARWGGFGFEEQNSANKPWAMSWRPLADKIANNEVDCIAGFVEAEVNLNLSIWSLIALSGAGCKDFPRFSLSLCSLITQEEIHSLFAGKFMPLAALSDDAKPPVSKRFENPFNFDFCCYARGHDYQLEWRWRSFIEFSALVRHLMFCCVFH